MTGVVVAMPLHAARRELAVVCLSLLVLLSGALATATSVRASTDAPTTARGQVGANNEAAPLKAVIIVGPAGSLTAQDLVDAEQVAVIAESYGMDVRRVYHPHATWDAVMANIQGANLVYYAGHGYGWPSPYTRVLTESRQNGVGLNTYDGSRASEHTYYGGTLLRENWVLAPNAIVFLNHDCYTAGNGEPGTAKPSWDVARQRVDNFAASFLAIGARAVFAYSYQRFNKTLMSLLTTDQTMEQIFQTPGPKPNAFFGWIGYDPRKFDSQRTPGATNYMDPDPKDGFLRAVTGDLNMTAGEWAQGAPVQGNDDPPALSDFTAQAPQGPAFASQDVPVFTPNGDGVTDSVSLSYTVDREAFVDMTVADETGNTLRSMSSWSPAGAGKASWDGRTGNGDYVADGVYQVTATPRNRAGTTGNSETVHVTVVTTMSNPKATPNMLYAADGDSLGNVTDLSVTLDELATFWWKIADASGNVVRTKVNGAPTDPGTMTWQWDGRDHDGNLVPEGTYYSVTTTATAAGMSVQSVPVDVRAFRLTPDTAAPFVRGTTVKVFVESAEPVVGKVKVRVTVEGMTPKTFAAKAVAGGWMATIKFAATGLVGNVVFSPYGTDVGGQPQQTDYTFELR